MHLVRFGDRVVNFDLMTRARLNYPEGPSSSPGVRIYFGPDHYSHFPNTDPETEQVRRYLLSMAIPGEPTEDGGVPLVGVEVVQRPDGAYVGTFAWGPNPTTQYQTDPYSTVDLAMRAGEDLARSKGFKPVRYA